MGSSQVEMLFVGGPDDGDLVLADMDQCDDEFHFPRPRPEDDGIRMAVYRRVAWVGANRPTTCIYHFHGYEFS